MTKYICIQLHVCIDFCQPQLFRGFLCYSEATTFLVLEVILCRVMHCNLGVEASMLREISYSSVRMGLYEPIRALLSASAADEAVHASPLVKFLSALLSGGIGSALANRESLRPCSRPPPLADACMCGEQPWT